MISREQISDLEGSISQALASANVMFQRTYGQEVRTRRMVHQVHLDAYIHCLRRVRLELSELAEDQSTAVRLFSVVDEEPDSIDYVNHLIRAGRGRSFADLLRECIWDVIRDRVPAEMGGEDSSSEPQLVHAVKHAGRLFDVGVSALNEYLALLKRFCTDQGHHGLPRLEPAGLGSLAEDAVAVEPKNSQLSPAMMQVIRDQVRSRDIFATSRTFRYSAHGLRPGALGDIRSLDNFYGYRSEREFFKAHFELFVAGEKVLPLLLGGMPGVGKTHLTIAHALSLPGVTLVNANQDQLEEPLEELLLTLGRHHYRRFVVFFDDIDPEAVEWSTFRNQIDGYWPMVKNVAIVIATNGEFSPQVRSRCKLFDFRDMDPVVCQEFVTEYLEEHRWMSQPYPNLVSTIGADYASMFKQRIFNELTPRSLIRYFETLEGNTDKIRRLIRESLEDIVRIPSEEAFEESNNQILDRMRRERAERYRTPGPPQPNPTFGLISPDALPESPLE